MKVADLIKLLLQADPEASVHYSFLASSEYGEYIEGEGLLDEDSIVMDDDIVTFHCM